MTPFLSGFTSAVTRWPPLHLDQGTGPLNEVAVQGLLWLDWRPGTWICPSTALEEPVRLVLRELDRFPLMAAVEAGPQTLDPLGFLRGDRRERLGAYPKN